jgi:hypothetical protein
MKHSMPHRESAVKHARKPPLASARVPRQAGQQNTTQLRFVEHDQVIEAFAPNRSDEALDVAVLPR